MAGNARRRDLEPQGRIEWTGRLPRLDGATPEVRVTFLVDSLQWASFTFRPLLAGTPFAEPIHFVPGSCIEVRVEMDGPRFVE